MSSVQTAQPGSCEREIGAAADAKEAVQSLKDFDQKTLAIEGEEQRSFIPGKPKPTFVLLNQELRALSTMLESADAGPNRGNGNCISRLLPRSDKAG
jgi:hypothetical protein